MRRDSFNVAAPYQKAQPPPPRTGNLKRKRFRRNSTSATCVRRRESYKIASNARRRNNFPQSFLKQTCSRHVCQPQFDWPRAGTKSSEPTGGHPIGRTLRYSGCAVTQTKRNVGYVASVKRQSQTACPSHFEDKQNAQDENHTVRRLGNGGYAHRADARNGAGPVPEGVPLGPSSPWCVSLGPLKPPTREPVLVPGLRGFVDFVLAPISPPARLQRQPVLSPHTGRPELLR
jgi:hypothetical protein